MAGSRKRTRERLETLFGPPATPESLAARAEQGERAAATLERARRTLTTEQRRWLAAFELEARMGGGPLDLARVARHVGRDVDAARRALADLREVLGAHGFRTR